MKTILVIDDDALFRGMVKQLLEREGYNVVEADNGISGLKQFQLFLPDMVLCDLIMPEKEGIETIIELRNIKKELPIIAMSGGGKKGGEIYLETAEGLGANAIFSKPFIHREFLDAIAAYLEVT